MWRVGMGNECIISALGNSRQSETYSFDLYQLCCLYMMYVCMYVYYSLV